MGNESARILIDQAVAIGAGQSIRLSKTVENHSLECYYVDANASVTAVVVDLEASLDPPEINDANALWYQIGRLTFTAGEITAKRAAGVILDMPVRRVRANIITLTGEDGSTDNFTVRYRENGEDR